MNTQLEHDLYDFICSDFANYERQDIAGCSISIEYVLGYKQAGMINLKFKILDHFVLYTLHVYGMSRDENKMLNIKRQMTAYSFKFDFQDLYDHITSEEIGKIGEDVAHLVNGKTA